MTGFPGAFLAIHAAASTLLGPAFASSAESRCEAARRILRSVQNFFPTRAVPTPFSGRLMTPSAPITALCIALLGARMGNLRRPFQASAVAQPRDDGGIREPIRESTTTPRGVRVSCRAGWSGYPVARLNEVLR